MRLSERLKAELDEERRLREHLSNLLEQTANALKGEPEPLHLHNWSDLPEVARQLERDKSLLQSSVKQLEVEVGQLRATLERYADKGNWGYYDASGCPKGAGEYADACFLGPGPAGETLGDGQDASVASSDGAEK